MWKYYENGKEETYSNLELLHLYQNIIDKQEYSCFTDWMYDKAIEYFNNWKG